MTLLNDFRIDKPFYEITPQLINLWPRNRESNKHDKENKQKDKHDKHDKHDNAYLWAIALYSDPKSKLYSLPEAIKVDLIKKDVYKGFDKTNKEQEKDIEDYRLLCTSKAARLLNSWETKLEEVHQVIDKAEMNIETAKLILGMMADLKNAWKHYAEVKKMFEEEQAEQVFGGAQESLSESGAI